VTPVNYAYEQCSVKRFGAKGNGSVSDVAAFQLAIDVARYETGGSGVILVPPPDSKYVIDEPLDCTFDTSANQRGIRFIGTGSNCQDDPAAILLSHTGYGFDLTGCDSFSFENLSIRSESGTQPQVCFFLARNSTGGSIFPRFHHVKVNGYFSKTVLYNYGAENGIYHGCQWYNYSTTAGTAVVELTSANVRSLTSSFATIYGSPVSTTDHEFFGGQFANFSDDTAAVVFKLAAITGLKVYAPWMHCGNPATAGGRAYFYVDSSDGPSSRIVISDVKGEDAANYTVYGIRFGNEGTATHSEWAIRNCYLPNTTSPISAQDSSQTLDKFDVRQLTQQATHAMSVPGTLQYSTIDGGASLGLNIGTSKENLLFGDKNNWSITTRNKDSWNDTGSAASTWTATTGGVTVVGGITTNRGLIAYHGKLVTATVYLAAGTSIASGAGGSIAGLPIAAADYSANVLVSDPNTNLTLGTGHMSGTTIYLPSITARAGIVVTATYFAV